MTTVLNRMLAIRANAAGPYKVTGPCHDCGADEALAALPQLFAVSIAVCRRCRFNRTGIPDRRNLLQGEASIAGEMRIQGENKVFPPCKQPVALLPSVCPTTAPEDEPEIIRAILGARALINAQEVHLSPRDAAEILGIDDVDDIFAPWTEDDDEKRD